MKTVLIIDDDPGMRQRLAEVVHGIGYHPVLHADIETALVDLASGGPIDAALVDITMPGMDGFDFLVQASRSSPRVPCIMFSANGSIEGYLKAIHLGAAEYLAKPFRTNDLIKVLSSILGNAGKKTGEKARHGEYANDTMEEFA